MKVSTSLLLAGSAGLIASANAQDFCDTVTPNSFSLCPPTGFCEGSPIIEQVDNATCDLFGITKPCFQYDLNNITLTDCVGNTDIQCYWVGDEFCDGPYLGTDLNCAEFDYDGGDCETVVDCDGEEYLEWHTTDGLCDDGSAYNPNFDCLDWNFDNGACGEQVTDCDGICVGDFSDGDVFTATFDDGTCQERFNCKKFEYSFGHCLGQCTDDWYDLGRPNYRCHQIDRNKNDERFAAVEMVPFDPCACYDWCQEMAEEKGTELTAFDHYSDKCRCWDTCSSETTLPCKGSEGKNADDFLGGDGRCPSAIYFPHDRVWDCHPDDVVQDVTRYVEYFNENYKNDGFCDNAQYGVMDYTYHDWVGNGSEPVGDYNCDTFDNDGEDCLLITCDERFEATQFAVLDSPNLVCDGQVTKETEWTTACDCYEFCNSGSDVEVLFQRNRNNECQCLSECESQSHCGLESDCQIFYVEPIYDCCGDDWTLGKHKTEVSEEHFGDFKLALDTVQFKYPKVLSWADVESVGGCIPAAFCKEHRYSFGDTDLLIDSPCLACEFDSNATLDAATSKDLRCDRSGLDAVRLAQFLDYYLVESEGGEGRESLHLNDYCGCEFKCKRYLYQQILWDWQNHTSIQLHEDNSGCLSVDVINNMTTWADEHDWAVDSYKGDCRCWSYCTPDTIFECTNSPPPGIQRCDLGPVNAVLMKYGPSSSAANVRDGAYQP